jgi:CelD/BcsL family acetyltransferase involved in cellulose biosynthesis
VTSAGAPGVEVRPFAHPDALWDALAARYGTAFHNSGWLRVLEQTQGAPLMKLGVYLGDQPVGIVPLFAKRFFPLRVAASPLVVEDTPYLGLACAPELTPLALEALSVRAKQDGIHFLRLLQRGRLVHAESGSATTYIDKHTHVVDLTQTEDEIWKRMERKGRTGIRKAEKSGVTVVRETGTDWIEPYYGILSALYLAQKMVTPNPLAFYQRLWSDFHAHGLFVLTARHEGKIVAGGIFLVDGDWAYYLNGCSLAAYNHLEPNRAIQWYAMRLAKSMGAEHYDFVGSDIPRLALFKRSFGGSLVSYTLIERASAPWVVTARRAFPELKRFANRIRSRVRPARLDA